MSFMSPEGEGPNQRTQCVPGWLSTEKIYTQRCAIKFRPINHWIPYKKTIFNHISTSRISRLFLIQLSYLLWLSSFQPKILPPPLEVDEICAQHGMTSLEMLISDCLDSYDDSSAKTWGTKFGSIAVKILTDVTWRCFFGECAGDFMDMHTIYIYLYVWYTFFRVTVMYCAYTLECILYLFWCYCNIDTSSNKKTAQPLVIDWFRGCRHLFVSKNWQLRSSGVNYFSAFSDPSCLRSFKKHPLKLPLKNPGDEVSKFFR